MLMAQWINEKSWLCPYRPPPTFPAKLILCVGPYSLILSGPGRPRYGALQAISAEPKLSQADVGLWTLEELRLKVAMGNLAQAGPLPVC